MLRGILQDTDYRAKLGFKSLKCDTRDLSLTPDSLLLSLTWVILPFSSFGEGKVWTFVNFCFISFCFLLSLLPAIDLSPNLQSALGSHCPFQVYPQVPTNAMFLSSSIYPVLVPLGRRKVIMNKGLSRARFVVRVFHCL